MRLNITGRHLEVTPALHDYVYKKSEKLKYFFPQLMEVDVYFIHNKTSDKVEVNVVSEGKTFFCEATSQDMYSSIDLVFDKLDRQIKKYKEKIMNHKAVTSTSQNSLSTLKTNDNIIKITKIKEILPKPMTGNEIILHLSLYSHRFEMFKEDKEKDYMAIALKKENNLYSIIDRNNGSWVINDYRLIGDKIEFIKTQKTEILELSQEHAINKLLEENLDYLVFYDFENKNLNIVYVRKDKTLGLITSGA